MKPSNTTTYKKLLSVSCLGEPDICHGAWCCGSSQVVPSVGVGHEDALGAVILALGRWRIIDG